MCTLKEKRAVKDIFCNNKSSAVITNIELHKQQSSKNEFLPLKNPNGKVN